VCVKLLFLILLLRCFLKNVNFDDEAAEVVDKTSFIVTSVNVSAAEAEGAAVKGKEKEAEEEEWCEDALLQDDQPPYGQDFMLVSQFLAAEGEKTTRSGGGRGEEGPAKTVMVIPEESKRTTSFLF